MLNCVGDFFLLNHRILPADEFSPDLFEEGTFIYEVFTIIDSVPLFYKEHMDRLYASAGLINFTGLTDLNTINADIDKLVEINRVTNGNVEIICNSDIKNKGSQNSCLVLNIDIRDLSGKEYRAGVPVDLFSAERALPNVKRVSLDLRRSTVKKLEKHKLYEVLLVDRNGYITEGSRSNVFFIKDRIVYTPPIHQVLPGITRQKIIDLCTENNIDVTLRKIHKKDLGNYDSLFLTSTSSKVLPVSSIGKLKYNTHDPLMWKIHKLFDGMIKDCIRNGRS